MFSICFQVAKHELKDELLSEGEEIEVITLNDASNYVLSKGIHGKNRFVIAQQETVGTSLYPVV